MYMSNLNAVDRDAVVRKRYAAQQEDEFGTNSSTTGSIHTAKAKSMMDNFGIDTMSTGRINAAGRTYDDAAAHRAVGGKIGGHLY